MKLNAAQDQAQIFMKNEAGQELRLNLAKIIINGKANEIQGIKANEIKTITEGDKITHVVPAIIIGEAVILGMGYEYEELASRQMILRFAQKWNDIPVVIYHTWDSAKEIETIEASLIGRVYKPKILENEDDPDESIRLLVELHIIEKEILKQKKGKKTLDRTLRGEMIEVSTGYYLTEYVQQRGKYNDKPFGGIQLDADPDHLAILPDQIGAYSIGMGGGLNRTNQEGKLLPLITNKEKGASMSKSKTRLLANGSFSEAVVTAMTDGEAELAFNAMESKDSKARDAEIERRNADFAASYPESDEGKLVIANAAKELKEKEVEKEYRDNSWTELDGKVNMTRDEFDAIPKAGVEAILNSVKATKAPLPGDVIIDNEAPKDTDPDKIEGDE